MEKTIGTVIGLHPYRETSLIVQWCTADHGIIRSVANGARRPKSGFAGQLDLFFKLEIGFVPGRRTSLHTLREVALLDPRLGLRQSYEQTLAASYFTKLLTLVAEERAPLEALATLLDRGLDHLGQHRPTRRAIHRFEHQMAAFLGLGNTGLRGIRQLFGQIPPIRDQLMRNLPN